jgi:hypothetical protein
MKHPILLVLLTAVFLRPAIAQELGEDVHGLEVYAISPTRVLLTWVPFEPPDHEASVTYSVFRGTAETFVPSLKSRIAKGITTTSYVTAEPKTSRDYYYYVKATIASVSSQPVVSNVYRVVKLEVRERDAATRMYPEDTPACWITVRNDRRTILAEHVSSGVVCDISVGDTVEVYSGDRQYLVKTGHPEEAHLSTYSPKFMYFIESEEER